VRGKAAGRGIEGQVFGKHADRREAVRHLKSDDWVAVFPLLHLMQIFFGPCHFGCDARVGMRPPNTIPRGSSRSASARRAS
jgi:hypothetical protein